MNINLTPLVNNDNDVAIQSWPSNRDATHGTSKYALVYIYGGSRPKILAAVQITLH